MATDLTFTIVELRSGMRVARMAKATDEVADELADELVAVPSEGRFCQLV